MVPNKKKKGDYYVNPCYRNWKANLNSKSGRETSFSYETKASELFTPIRRMWLWCPIMKRKVIIMWIYSYPNWRANLNSRNGRKRSFCYETKVSKSLITTSRMSL